MTRKDYIEVAKILKANIDFVAEATFDGMVYDFSEMFANDNENFDADRFADAIYGKDK